MFVASFMLLRSCNSLGARLSSAARPSRQPSNLSVVLLYLAQQSRNFGVRRFSAALFLVGATAAKQKRWQSTALQIFSASRIAEPCQQRLPPVWQAEIASGWR